MREASLGGVYVLRVKIGCNWRGTKGSRTCTTPSSRSDPGSLMESDTLCANDLDASPPIISTNIRFLRSHFHSLDSFPF